MISEEQGDAATTDNALNLVAASLLMFQFIIFFLFYNFTTNIYILGLGWILLIPGLILVILSAKTDIKESERLYRFTKLPKYFGWSIISISLSFITQHWVTSFLTIGFVVVMILDLRRIRVSKFS
ncbi:MAG: hypothetical protein RTU63_12745 [Candidatus Thorarchaeota archaeon]